jgi:hypothetical protein
MRLVESAARNLNLASILCMTLGCNGKSRQLRKEHEARAEFDW